MFFGEYCARLKVVGDVFVGLLQMTVMPYIILALIANLARMPLSQSRRLAKIGGAVLVLLWSVVLVTVFVLAQSYPSLERGSFFSSSAVDVPKDFDIVAVFVPSNVFAALSENHVPAVVLLCIFIGTSLAGIKKADQVVSLLDVLSKALLRISHTVARLTPVGVFAIAASTSGTITLDAFGRLQAHVITYSAGAIFLGLIVLPWLVAVLTPFRYRDVMAVTRNAMLTAFATGKLIIVLPLLIEETERLFEKYEFDHRSDSVPTVDILYPVAYPFPHVGKLLGILFVPFVAWFLGDKLQFAEYPKLLSSGLVSYFGGPNLAMPFLLDLMRLPQDMFQLFLVLAVFESRVGDALGAMHLAAFTLISATAFLGRLQLNVLPIMKFSAATLLIGVTILAGVRVVLAGAFDFQDDRQSVIAGMQLLDNPTSAVRIEEPAPNPSPLLPGEPLIDRIRRRGAIRIGYNEDKLPFAFINVQGDLVGFDIDMAHALARDLDVTIEFVRFDRKKLAQQLSDDQFDVAMSGLIGTLERAATIEHTEPYMDVTLGLVVRDHRARNFRSLQSLRRRKDLRIGFVDLSRGFVARLQDTIPDVTLIELRTNQEFFDQDELELDALLISAESGAAYTLLYPGFQVVVPTDLRVSLPLFYAIGTEDKEMDDFLDHWISLRKKDGTMQRFYNHWILGQIEKPAEPRWCVIRNVLHWVE